MSAPDPDTAALAAALAAAVAAWPRVQVPLEEMQRVAGTHDRSLLDSPDARVRIRAALDLLAAEQVIRLPAPLPAGRQWDSRVEPPLPLWVRRPPLPRSGAPRPAKVWRPELAVAAKVARREKDIDVLTRIEAFLRDGGANRPCVPYRERSLEVFGDEKRLDALRGSRLFRDGALFELLRCHEVVTPLTSYYVPGAGERDLRAGTVTLLVAENHHTFASLLRVCRRRAESGAPAVHVAWGAGTPFTSSVRGVELLDPPVGRIRYFGDLDRAGLTIPVNASAAARAAGLPPVEPAEPLWALLLDRGRRQQATPVPAETAVQLTGWLGSCAGQAAELLCQGVRLAQEAVGLELLDAWAGPLW